MTPITLWHELRQTRLITVLWERIQLLEQQCTLRRHENQILTLKCDALTAQLEASRLQHAKALQRVDSLEVALEHVYFDLSSYKRQRRKERMALRTWITRQTQPRITTN
ncbi:MAG: hypothetical protein R2932_59155 [Caldilineaceae bacterium]